MALVKKQSPITVKTMVLTTGIMMIAGGVMYGMWALSSVLIREDVAPAKPVAVEAPSPAPVEKAPQSVPTKETNTEAVPAVAKGDAGSDGTYDDQWKGDPAMAPSVGKVDPQPQTEAPKAKQDNLGRTDSYFSDGRETDRSVTKPDSSNDAMDPDVYVPDDREVDRGKSTPAPDNTAPDKDPYAPDDRDS
jgi:hypothetical protein